MMHDFLKSRIKELADESRISRKQEQRLYRRIASLTKRQKGPTDALELSASLMHSKRVHELRTESRGVHLARCFLKGRRYREVEGSRNPAKESEFETALGYMTRTLTEHFHNEGLTPGYHTIDKTVQKWIEPVVQGQKAKKIISEAVLAA